VAEEHPNASLIRRLDLRDLASAATHFSEGAVWRYFNPLLPEIQGDHVGLSGIQSFFGKIGAITGDTFRVEPVSITPVGDELVVVQTRNSMTLQGRPIATDVVVVWRIVDGRVTEVWDIPSVYTSPAEPNG